MISQPILLSAKCFHASLSATKPSSLRSAMFHPRAFPVFSSQPRPFSKSVLSSSRSRMDAKIEHRCFSVSVLRGAHRQEVKKTAEAFSGNRNDFRQDRMPLPTYFKSPAQEKAEPSKPSRRLRILRSLRVFVKTLFILLFSMGCFGEIQKQRLTTEQRIMLLQSIIKRQEKNFADIVNRSEELRQANNRWIPSIVAILMTPVDIGVIVGAIYMKAYEMARQTPEMRLLLQQQELQEVLMLGTKEQMVRVAAEFHKATGKDFTQHLSDDLHAFDEHCKAGTLETFKSNVMKEIEIEIEKEKERRKNESHAEPTVLDVESSSDSSEDV